METVIKKHLDVEKIERIARENKYDKQAYKFFLSELEKELNKELFLGFTDKSEDSIISRVVEFIREIEVFRKKGYGIEWASEYVYRSHRPEKVHALAFACQAVRGHDKSTKLENLELYARLTGRDEYFVDYFNLLLGDPEEEVVFDMPYEEEADSYSNIIKKLLAEGKSKLYAKHYALFAVNYAFPPYRCHIAGMEADMADTDKIDKGDLVSNIDKLSGYIYDNFDVYEDSLTDEKANRMRKEYAKYLI